MDNLLSHCENLLTEKYERKVIAILSSCKNGQKRSREEYHSHQKYSRG